MPRTGAADKEEWRMEKNQKSNYAEQEALRQFGVFSAPIPAPPPERKLDKMKEAPDPARSLEREER